MEFDLTPNRADALSMVGTAYETSALYGAPLTLPETQPDTISTSAGEELSVKVDNPEKYLIIVHVLLRM